MGNLWAMEVTELNILTNALRFADDSESSLDILLFPFGGPLDGNDLYGEHFDENTDLCLKWYPTRPLLYHHGLDPETGLDTVGEIPSNSIRTTDLGHWVQAQLDTSHKYHNAIKEIIRKKKMFSSSGAMHHLVEVDKKTKAIKVWPWVEGSLTVAPANFDASVDFATAQRHWAMSGKSFFLPDDAELKYMAGTRQSAWVTVHGRHIPIAAPGNSATGRIRPELTQHFANAVSQHHEGQLMGGLTGLEVGKLHRHLLSAGYHHLGTAGEGNGRSTDPNNSRVIHSISLGDSIHHITTEPKVNSGNEDPVIRDDEKTYDVHSHIEHVPTRAAPGSMGDREDPKSDDDTSSSKPDSDEDMDDDDYAHVDEDGKRHLPLRDESHVHESLEKFGGHNFADRMAKAKAAKKLLDRAKHFGVEPDDDHPAVEAAKSTGDDDDDGKSPTRAVDPSSPDDETPRGDLDNSEFAYVSTDGVRYLPIDTHDNVAKSLEKFSSIHFQNDEQKRETAHRLLARASHFSLAPDDTHPVVKATKSFSFTSPDQLLSALKSSPPGRWVNVDGHHLEVGEGQGDGEGSDGQALIGHVHRAVAEKHHGPIAGGLSSDEKDDLHDHLLDRGYEKVGEGTERGHSWVHHEKADDDGTHRVTTHKLDTDEKQQHHVTGNFTPKEKDPDGDDDSGLVPVGNGKKSTDVRAMVRWITTKGGHRVPIGSSGTGMTEHLHNAVKTQARGEIASGLTEDEHSNFHDHLTKNGYEKQADRIDDKGVAHSVHRKDLGDGRSHTIETHGDDVDWDETRHPYGRRGNKKGKSYTVHGLHSDDDEHLLGSGKKSVELTSPTRAVSFLERQRELWVKSRSSLEDINSQNGENSCMALPRALYDGYGIFDVTPLPNGNESQDGTSPKTYKVTYDLDDQGHVAHVGSPEEVEMEWVPVPSSTSLTQEARYARLVVDALTQSTKGLVERRKGEGRRLSGTNQNLLTSEVSAIRDAMTLMDDILRTDDVSAVKATPSNQRARAFLLSASLA